MVFNKRTKTIQWGKVRLFQEMMLGKLGIHMQKNEGGHVPYAIYKDGLAQDLKVRVKTIKF